MQVVRSGIRSTPLCAGGQIRYSVYAALVSGTLTASGIQFLVSIDRGTSRRVGHLRLWEHQGVNPAATRPGTLPGEADKADDDHWALIERQNPGTLIDRLAQALEESVHFT